MKVIFEATRGRLKNIEAYEKAIHILEFESLQGFFRARHDSVFKKFSEKSPVEDGKKIDLHVAKVYGKGSYRLVGNLGYNSTTKEIKFYTTTVYENDSFRYDDKSLVEFINSDEGTFRDHQAELEKIIQKLKETKPTTIPGKGYNKNRPKQYGGGTKKFDPKKKKIDPRRQGPSDSQKEKKEKKNQSKNFRTDSRRKVSNNKKQSF